MNLTDVETLIKSVRLKPENIQPFTTGCTSDEDSAKQAGYERGFMTAQRRFRAELLRVLRGNPKAPAIDVAAEMEKALQQEIERMPAERWHW